MKAKFRKAQTDYPVTNQILLALSTFNKQPTHKQWYHPPLRHYRLVCPLLTTVDSVACEQHKPGPTSDGVSVQVMPLSLRYHTLHCTHNVPTAGDQGTNKSLECLQQEAYWVSIAADIDCHCQNCTTCQQSQLTATTRASMTSMPIGCAHHILIAVDVLKVPLLTATTATSL